MLTIAYTYDSDYHCIDCTVEHFKQKYPYIGIQTIHDIEILEDRILDNENNKIHPIFITDEILDTNWYCHDNLTHEEPELVAEMTHLTESGFRDIFLPVDLQRHQFIDGELTLRFFLSDSQPIIMKKNFDLVVQHQLFKEYFINRILSFDTDYYDIKHQDNVLDITIEIIQDMYILNK